MRGAGTKRQNERGPTRPHRHFRSFILASAACALWSGKGVGVADGTKGNMKYSFHTHTTSKVDILDLLRIYIQKTPSST